MAVSLPRLPRGVRLIDEKGAATQTFQQWWQSLAKALETTDAEQDTIITDLADAVTAIQAAQDAADAANTAAAAADAAAAAAQGAADNVEEQTNLTASGVSGATITATDVGASVTVAISAHDRTYGDGSTVSVSAGNVTGLSYSTTYFIYYTDPSRTGGAVTYQATTSQTTAAQFGDTHMVGAVTTPAALGAPVDGNYVGLPGISDIYVPF